MISQNLTPSCIKTQDYQDMRNILENLLLLLPVYYHTILGCNLSSCFRNAAYTLLQGIYLKSQYSPVKFKTYLLPYTLPKFQTTVLCSNATFPTFQYPPFISFFIFLQFCLCNFKYQSEVSTIGFKFFFKFFFIEVDLIYSVVLVPDVHLSERFYMCIQYIYVYNT